MTIKPTSRKTGMRLILVIFVLTLGYVLGSIYPYKSRKEPNIPFVEEPTYLKGTVFPYEVFIYNRDKIYDARLVFTVEKILTPGFATNLNGTDPSSKYITGAFIILMDENYTVRRFMGNYATTELGTTYFTRVAEWLDPVDVGSNSSEMVSWIGKKGVEITKRPIIHTWDLETNELKDYNIRTHHDYQIVDNTIFHFLINPVVVENITLKWDLVTQSDLEGNVLWQYDTSRYIDADWNTGAENDPTHLNSLHFDGEKVYINARSCDTFFVIDYEECEMLYAVGTHGNFTMLEGSQWKRSHSYVKLNETDFLMFDNLFEDTSRVVHNRLDFEDMTCEMINEWVLPLDLMTDHWGKVQQLPNGNVLITAGVDRHTYSSISEYPVGAAILEYTQDGELVMKIQFPVDWGICQSAYKETN